MLSKIGLPELCLFLAHLSQLKKKLGWVCVNKKQNDIYYIYWIFLVFKFLKTHISWHVLLAKFYLPYIRIIGNFLLRNWECILWRREFNIEFQNIFHTFSFPRSQHFEFFDHNLFIWEKWWKIFVGCNFPLQPFKIPTMITGYFRVICVWLFHRDSTLHNGAPRCDNYHGEHCLFFLPRRWKQQLQDFLAP